MSTVRIGIVGIGNMGSVHVRNLEQGAVKGAVLAAVCDTTPAKLARFDKIPVFTSATDLLKSGTVDAVLIATPHYDHTTIGIQALKAGVHVLVEKPISVHKADAQKLISAYKNPKQVFAAMFNQRTDPYYIKLRNLIKNGELGELRRINWIITTWFRSEAYYASGGWRATWAGEGGGVLLNQCPHQLDLMQWLFGMPKRVRAFCHFGKYHDIEVEDDVTAYLEYANGATGVFITSTGEAPGTNRLEVVGERGKVVLEDDKIQFTRNEVETTEFSRTTQESFSRPDTWDVRIPASGHGGQWVEVLQNFTDAILHGAPLLAPAVEGIHSVELANAMLMSAFTEETVEIPLNARAYEKILQEKIAKSKGSRRKKVVRAVSADMSKSFS
jgi:predicted dehydrogenase